MHSSVQYVRTNIDSDAAALKKPGNEEFVK